MFSIFICLSFFFFKQKTAYEVRISDWSSDVCSSDLKIGWSPGAVFGLSAAKGASLVPVPAKSNVPLATHGTDIIFVIRRITKDEIGRASCRERVCQYV